MTNKEKSKEIAEHSQCLSDFPHDYHSVEYGAIEMAKWKEQQMIKKAIECCIGDFNFFINVNDMNDYIEYIQSQGLKSGDKVKVILIKTEQSVEKGE